MLMYFNCGSVLSHAQQIQIKQNGRLRTIAANCQPCTTQIVLPRPNAKAIHFNGCSNEGNVKRIILSGFPVISAVDPAF